MGDPRSETSSLDGSELLGVTSDALSLASVIDKVGNNLSSLDELTPEPSVDDSPSEGSQVSVQVLYEGPPKCRCCKNWVEEPPDDLRMAVEDRPETKRKALIVRMAISHDEGKPLVLDSIVVQSPSLKKTLGKVFAGYNGITPSLKKLVFKAPFHPFYYRWKTLRDIYEQQKRRDSPDVIYTQLLYEILEKELRERMAEIEDHISQEVISYPLLWAIFEPGIRIFSVLDDDERFYLVTGTSYDTKEGFFQIKARYVDWDGRKFGYALATLLISAFSGTQHIRDIPFYPEAFHLSLTEAHHRVIMNGRVFRDLQGVHYKAYSGAMWWYEKDKKRERHVDDRIIIDAASYLEANQDGVKGLTLLQKDSPMPRLQVSDDPRWGFDNEGDSNAPQTPADKHPTAGELTDDQLLLCNTHVAGYSSKLKQWGMFDVTKMRPIAWNSDAFSYLMLPEGYENLVISFVDGRETSRNVFDDIIEGKGLGVIMHLVGAPGTGKTLTAEAVADRVQKPLYMLSAGELGQSAKDVEDHLRRILELTERWDAVLLFDECDVFLQERSVEHIAHNEVVAVFLRLLEYYRGFLFLTSNRADTIDRAVKSRIHLTLHYPDLDVPAKEQIWRQFMMRSNIDNTLTDGIYQRLSKLSMNGRQIKNVIKIAILLAAHEKVPLGMDQIRTVLLATREVDPTDL